MNKVSSESLSLSKDSNVIVIIGINNHICLPVEAVKSEESDRLECTSTPYASVVKLPSVKKDNISIVVIIGVRDLIGDTYIAGEFAYEACRKEILRMFDVLMRNRKNLPIRIKRSTRDNECNEETVMRYLSEYSVEVDVWLMMNSLRQDVNHSKDLKGLKTFIQVGKGTVVCYGPWEKEHGLKESDNFIKAKVSECPNDWAVFTSCRENPGTFLKGHVFREQKVLSRSISRNYDKVFR